MKLNKEMKRRWERQGRRWNRYTCLICGKEFKDTCPHSISQNERADQLLKDREGII